MDPWSDFGLRMLVTAILAIFSGGIGAVISFLVTLFLRYRHERWLSQQLRKAAEAYARQHGNLKEVALVASVREDIKKAVEEYLKKADRQGMPILPVHQAEGFGNQPEKWQAYLEKVKAEVRRIREEGFSRVYVFTNGPVALALMIGATLTNGPLVVVHQYDTASGSYYEVGHLTVESVRL
jgi:hypothetical protein